MIHGLHLFNYISINACCNSIVSLFEKDNISIGDSLLLLLNVCIFFARWLNHVESNYIDKSMGKGKGLHVNRAHKATIQSRINIDINHDEVVEHVQDINSGIEFEVIKLLL